MFRAALIAAIIGIAGYLAFLAAIDVPMYLARWRTEVTTAAGRSGLSRGLRDVTRGGS